MKCEGFKILSFLVISFVCTSTQRLDKTKKLCEVDNLREFVLEKIEEIGHNINQNDWQYSAKKKLGLDGQLLVEFKDICDKVVKTDELELPQYVTDSNWPLSVIVSEGSNIDDFFRTFKRFTLKPDSLIYNQSWNEFAEHSLLNSPNKHSVLKSLAVIQEIVSEESNGNKNVFQATSAGYKNSKCVQEQSVQQLLFNVYKKIQIAQIKAYTVIQYALMLLKLNNKDTYSMRPQKIRQDFYKNVSQQSKSILEELKKSPNYLMKCDPPEHIKEETYTEITRFLQGYIVNEVDLNRDNTCEDDCKFYKYTRQSGCFQNQFCAQQQVCRGTIVGCDFVDADMWICQGPSFGDRRYDWIEYENGRTLGEKKSCSRAITKVDSWWRWLVWHCSYCFCYCDDPKDRKSHRYFNIRSVVSDVANNKVITGLRFIKKFKVIHLQIQEGELVKEGQINASSVTWHPVDKYDVDDSSVKDGIDYHTLTWEHRAVDLDDLVAPKDHVLTGIRFRKVGTHLNLEIQATEFDFSTGKLIKGGSKSQWISNDNTDASILNPRTKIILKQPDVPTRIGKTEPDSKSDQFVEFTSSDLEYDAGQTAVPFIDTQIVAPSPPVPLAGAGLYHKGKRFSGGYIAPKVFTYNYAPHIRDVFPETNDAQF